MFIKTLTYTLLAIFLLSCNQTDELQEIKRLIDNNQYKETIPKLSAYISQHPQSKDALHLRYECHYKMGRLEEAKTDMDQLKNLGQSSALFYNQYGDLLYKLKQVDSAFHYLQLAYKLDSTVPSVNFNLAIIYYKNLDNDSMALKSINRELWLNYYDQKAHLLKASILNDMASFTSALREADEVLAIDKRNDDAYFEKAISYFSLKDWDNAIKNYSAAIAIDSNNDDYYLRRASTYLNAKNYPLCLTDLNHSILKNPNNVKAYYLKAYCYKEIGKFDSACINIKATLAIDPTVNVDNLKKRLNCD